jgi:hypothetical protein
MVRLKNRAGRTAADLVDEPHRAQFPARLEPGISACGPGGDG